MMRNKKNQLLDFFPAYHKNMTMLLDLEKISLVFFVKKLYLTE